MVSRTWQIAPHLCCASCNIFACPGKVDLGSGCEHCETTMVSLMIQYDSVWFRYHPTNITKSCFHKFHMRSSLSSLSSGIVFNCEDAKGCAQPGVANFRLWGTAPSCLMDAGRWWLKSYWKISLLDSTYLHGSLRISTAGCQINSGPGVSAEGLLGLAWPLTSLYNGAW